MKILPGGGREQGGGRANDETVVMVEEREYKGAKQVEPSNHSYEVGWISPNKIKLSLNQSETC